jgi:predicted PhzF superfamily epimerase YddE/YHI9
MPTTMSRRFVTVDVFTATPFSGNPLAVVLDAEDLSTARMQAIVREFNYVETTFVLPPVDPVHTARMVFRVPVVVEDPATGSANCALAALFAQFAPEPDAMLKLKVLQRQAMDRPSLLNLRAHKRRGIVGTVHVGGHCVEVMRGTLL